MRRGKAEIRRAEILPDIAYKRAGDRGLRALQKRLIQETHPHVRADKIAMRQGPYRFDQQEIDARDKANARQLVHFAVKTGRMIKEPCAACGVLQVQAHHPDYNRPLYVVWLCDYHHHAIHLLERRRRKEAI